MSYKTLSQEEVRNRVTNGILDVTGLVDNSDGHLKQMEYANRVACLPCANELTDEERVRACGLDDPNKEIETMSDLIVQQQEGRLPLLKRLSHYGQRVQLVGGHPSAKEWLRPDGVDQVWAINPRGHQWPDEAPDFIVTRDWVYLTGQQANATNPPQYGVEMLKRFPNVPVIVTADIGGAVARCLNGESEMDCPEWFLDRPWFELALQNFFDTRFSCLSGFSIGAGLTAVRHAGAKIILTGVVCHRSDEEWALVTAGGGKTVEKQKLEDLHIAHEVREFLNKYGGKCVWTHGPTVPGSVAPVWTGSLGKQGR